MTAFPGFECPRIRLVAWLAAPLFAVSAPLAWSMDVATRGAPMSTPATEMLAAVEPAAPAGSVAPAASAEVEQIRAALASGEFDRALSEATRMIAAQPRNPDGYALQGAAYMGKHDYAVARRSLDKALAIQADLVPALVASAQLDTMQGDVASARKRLDTVLAKDPGNEGAMLGMAQVEAVQHHDKEGLAWLEKAKAAHPDASAPRIYLGAYYVRTRNYERAIAELGDALKIHPDNPQTLELLGQAQFAGGRKADAQATFEKLAAIAPQSAEAQFWLGNARVATQNAAGARESYNKALQLKPDYADAAFALAGLDVREGRTEDAMRLARDLQAKAPDSPAGLTLEGDVLMAQHRARDAVASYEKAFARRESALLAIKLHAARAGAGDSDADAKLERWLESHPTETGAWHYLAEQNMKAGHDKRAIVFYERVVKQDPQNVAALNNLALLYQKQKDTRSVAMAEQAYRLMPDSPAITDTLGWILVQNGNAARGTELLQRAVAASPDNASLRYHLAVALARSGDKANARKELDTVLAGNRAFAERDAARRLRDEL
ncbi:MAG TPA: XrtA/PEP-CTERM system TPR-repeat protein PrsT [Casimicrobiaceae bacterium]|nr:XrtA/PEP-CTERM system TPR-repeat protein PrsT [Casimicrobiaceae bacterium]